MKRIAVLLLLACFAGAVAAPLCGGIDLVALKKREEERRKKLGKSKAKVTDGNVASISVDGKPYGFVQMESDEPGEEGEASAPPPGADDAKTPLERQPDYWKKQQDDLTQRIATLRGEIERGQLDLNRLWSDFYIKNVAAEQEAIRVQIAQLTNQIEQKKLFLTQAEAQLEDLYEKARKAGVPPGWLR